MNLLPSLGRYPGKRPCLLTRLANGALIDRVGPFAWPLPTGDKAFFSTSSDSDVDVWLNG